MFEGHYVGYKISLETRKGERLLVVKKWFSSGGHSMSLEKISATEFSIKEVHPSGMATQAFVERESIIKLDPGTPDDLALITVKKG